MLAIVEAYIWFDKRSQIDEQKLRNADILADPFMYFSFCDLASS